VGFSEGELSFQVNAHLRWAVPGGRFAPVNMFRSAKYTAGVYPRVRISIPQDVRDLAVLQSIHKGEGPSPPFGCGSVQAPTSGRQVWYYRCDTPSAISSIILPFYLENGLHTSKQLDLEDFKLALDLILAIRVAHSDAKLDAPRR